MKKSGCACSGKSDKAAADGAARQHVIDRKGYWEFGHDIAVSHEQTRQVRTRMSLEQQQVFGVKLDAEDGRADVLLPHLVRRRSKRVQI